MKIKPDIKNMNQLDAAVLFEKYHILNAMLVRGTDVEKKRAKEELGKLDETISDTVNLHAIAAALHELKLKPDVLRAQTNFSFK